MIRTVIPDMNKSFSQIGLGCVTFGREIERQTSFSIMDYAVENGITFFDTAAAYGDGASEKIIGEWVADRRPASGSILIATKILPPFNSRAIIYSVEQSLRRMGAEAIDLLYLHRWDESVEKPDTLRTLDDLIKAGKIKMLGVSNFNAAQLEKVLQLQKDNGYNLFRTIQNNNNFAVRDINHQILEICSEYDLKIVTYSPLGAGFLTGKYKNKIGSDTRFSLIKGHQEIYFNPSAFQRLDDLEWVSSLTGHSTSHLALVWALRQPGITSVLIGGRSKEQLKQAFSALTY